MKKIYKTKVCSRCRKRKNTEKDFRKRKRDGYGYTECRKCEKERSSAWQKTEAGRRSRKKSYRRLRLLYWDRELERGKKYRKENPLKFRNYELKKNYGITLEEWKILFNLQGKVCKICKSSKPNIKNQWFTDHKPIVKTRSGEKIIIRGILCGYCNSILGYAKDSIFILKSAIKYLEMQNE